MYAQPARAECLQSLVMAYYAWRGIPWDDVSFAEAAAVLLAFMSGNL